MNIAVEKPDDQSHRNIYFEQYAQHKLIPDTLRSEVLSALSYYPELKDTRIKFIFKDNIRKFFMQAQPVLNSMLGNKENREYVIYVSRYFKIGDNKIFVHDMPFNILVGWIGHELGHIMDYKSRGFFSMVKFAIGYLVSKSFLIGAERVADTYAIQHGLAEKIIETKNFILNHAALPEQYKSKIRRLYMPPEEVMMIVEGKL